MYEQTEKPLRELARLEPLIERARLMTTVPPDPAAPNGMKMVRVVALDKIADTATLEVHFYNRNYLSGAGSVALEPVAKNAFRVSGGSRLRAGGAAGQVQVKSIVAVAGQPILKISISPIGDYSTYTLSLTTPAGRAWRFDPLFAEIRFKFRPGCFNNNCAPEWETAPPPFDEPAIDYLAKDYGSFRETMIAAMSQRVPGWQPTSEADLDMVIAELFAVAADELSDYQDRVANEAFLASARKRVSVARHARLMDYHIHQGSQASTLLALEIGHDVGKKDFLIGEGLTAFTGAAGGAATSKPSASAVVFRSRHGNPVAIHQYLNNIGLYTWGDSITALPAGSTRADLQLYRKFYLDDAGAAVEISTKAAVDEIVKILNDGAVPQLVIRERLNPENGLLNGFNPAKRQLLNVVRGGAEAIQDIVTGAWMVRVRWEKKDALKFDYCFTVDCPVGVAGVASGPVKNVSLFHGNLVEVVHGRSREILFREEGEELTEFDADVRLDFHFERTRWGAICRLPQDALAYRQTTPGGDVPPQSTLRLTVEVPPVVDPWNEVPNFIHSDDAAETGDHFVVETDENRRSLIRFGNGRNGRELPDGALVRCKYQYGLPLDGNIGRDRLRTFDPATVVSAKANPADPAPPPIMLRQCWNPFDVVNGVDREPVHEIIRRVPEAYRARQLRAVTLADYVARAEEIDGVSRAAAAYMWTGSWRTVRVTIDPEGTTELSYELRERVGAYLDAVRLIGEDLEIRPPKFVPLEIVVTLCVRPNVWREDVRFVLEQEFSTGWTPDGRRGFFHPDEWTFGQKLYASQIIGRAIHVEGVEHAVERKSVTPSVSVSIKRRNVNEPPRESITDLAPNEIIQVANDPDHLELGTIAFEVKGGRQ